MAENSALILIAPETDPKVVALLTEVNGLLEYARKRVIAADEDLLGAANDLALIKNLSKSIKEKQKEYADPVKGHLEAINDAFSLLIVPLGEAKQITDDKVLAYRRIMEVKRQEIEEINRMRLEAAQREAKLNGTGEISESVNLIPDVPLPFAHIRTEAVTIGTRHNTKWEVVDFKLLPDEYKLPDSAKLTRVTRAGGPGMTIPGVRIWQDETLTTKVRP